MVVGGTNKLQDVKTMYDVTAPDESLLVGQVLSIKLFVLALSCCVVSSLKCLVHLKQQTAG